MHDGLVPRKTDDPLYADRRNFYKVEKSETKLDATIIILPSHR
jgi:hypothetical protein